MTTYSLTGTCYDVNNTVVASAEVHAFLTADDSEAAQVTANGSGVYSFTGLASQGPYYLVAYKAGSPDIAGTTLNTIMGIEEGGSSGTPMGMLLTLTYP